MGFCPDSSFSRTNAEKGFVGIKLIGSRKFGSYLIVLWRCNLMSFLDRASYQGNDEK